MSELIYFTERRNVESTILAFVRPACPSPVKQISEQMNFTEEGNVEVDVENTILINAMLLE